MQPPPGPSSQQIGVLVARPPLLPGSLVQSPYGHVVLSLAMAPISGCGPYQASGTGAVLPSGTPNVGSAQLYGMTQLPSSAAAYPGPYQLPGSLVGPSSSNQKEQAFPERSNQPDYQYYPKAGEVKVGPSYRYHPPPETTAPKANVTLSPAGLPLCPVMVASQPCYCVVSLIELLITYAWPSPAFHIVGKSFAIVASSSLSNKIL